VRQADCKQQTIMVVRAALLGGLQDIIGSERRRCREASGGAGPALGSARLCGEGVRSLETMGGWTCLRTTHKGGASPCDLSEPHRCTGARGPAGAHTTKAQVISP